MTLLASLLALLIYPPHEPDLCDLDGGQYCTPCGPEPDYSYQCHPAAAEGWLCCLPAGPCVAVATYDDCTGGIAGWCADYTTETLPNGVEVAVCEDPG
jgi:hypothetical protein